MISLRLYLAFMVSASTVHVWGFLVPYTLGGTTIMIDASEMPAMPSPLLRHVMGGLQQRRQHLPLLSSPVHNIQSALPPYRHETLYDTQDNVDGSFIYQQQPTLKFRTDMQFSQPDSFKSSVQQPIPMDFEFDLSPRDKFTSNFGDENEVDKSSVSYDFVGTGQGNLQLNVIPSHPVKNNINVDSIDRKDHSVSNGPQSTQAFMDDPNFEELNRLATESPANLLPLTVTPNIHGQSQEEHVNKEYTGVSVKHLVQEQLDQDDGGMPGDIFVNPDPIYEPLAPPNAAGDNQQTSTNRFRDEQSVPEISLYPALHQHHEDQDQNNWQIPDDWTAADDDLVYRETPHEVSIPVNPTTDENISSDLLQPPQTQDAFISKTKIPVSGSIKYTKKVSHQRIIDEAKRTSPLKKENFKTDISSPIFKADERSDSSDNSLNDTLTVASVENNEQFFEVTSEAMDKNKNRHEVNLPVSILQNIYDQNQLVDESKKDLTEKRNKPSSAFEPELLELNDSEPDADERQEPIDILDESYQDNLKNPRLSLPQSQGITLDSLEEQRLINDVKQIVESLKQDEETHPAHHVSQILGSDIMSYPNKNQNKEPNNYFTLYTQTTALPTASTNAQPPLRPSSLPSFQPSTRPPAHRPTADVDSPPTADVSTATDNREPVIISSAAAVQVSAASASATAAAPEAVPAPDATPTPAAIAAADDGVPGELLVEFEGVLQPATVDLLEKDSCRCGLRFAHRAARGEVARASEFPWLAVLTDGLTDTPLCGATIVSDRHLLTSALCVTGAKPNRLFVRAGESFPGGPALQLSVKSIKAHPRYRPNGKDFDIAVLLLKEPLVFSASLMPVCLPSSSAPAEVFRNGVVVKGLTRGRDGVPAPHTLRPASVDLIMEQHCKNASQHSGSSNAIHGRVICTNTPSKVACQGDNGGPLMVSSDNHIEIIGLRSWTDGCAEEKYPGIYTKVFPYSTWIHAKTRGGVKCSREAPDGMQVPVTRPRSEGRVDHNIPGVPTYRDVLALPTDPVPETKKRSNNKHLTDEGLQLVGYRSADGLMAVGEEEDSADETAPNEEVTRYDETTVTTLISMTRPDDNMEDGLYETESPVVKGAEYDDTDELIENQDNNESVDSAVTTERFINELILVLKNQDINESIDPAVTTESFIDELVVDLENQENNEPVDPAVTEELVDNFTELNDPSIFDLITTAGNSVDHELHYSFNDAFLQILDESNPGIEKEEKIFNLDESNEIGSDFIPVNNEYFSIGNPTFNFTDSVVDVTDGHKSTVNGNISTGAVDGGAGTSQNNENTLSMEINNSVGLLQMLLENVSANNQTFNMDSQINVQNDVDNNKVVLEDRFDTQVPDVNQTSGGELVTIADATAGITPPPSKEISKLDIENIEEIIRNLTSSTPLVNVSANQELGRLLRDINVSNGISSAGSKMPGTVDVITFDKIISSTEPRINGTIFVKLDNLLLGNPNVNFTLDINDIRRVIENETTTLHSEENEVLNEVTKLEKENGDEDAVIGHENIKSADTISNPTVEFQNQQVLNSTGISDTEAHENVTDVAAAVHEIESAVSEDEDGFAEFHLSDVIISEPGFNFTIEYPNRTTPDQDWYSKVGTVPASHDFDKENGTIVFELHNLTFVYPDTTRSGPVPGNVEENKERANGTIILGLKNVTIADSNFNFTLNNDDSSWDDDSSAHLEVSNFERENGTAIVSISNVTIANPSFNFTLKADSNPNEDTNTMTESVANMKNVNGNIDKKNGTGILSISNVTIADPQFNFSLNHDNLSSMPGTVNVITFDKIISSTEPRINGTIFVKLDNLLLGNPNVDFTLDINDIRRVIENETTTLPSEGNEALNEVTKLEKENSDDDAVIGHENIKSADTISNPTVEFQNQQVLNSTGISDAEAHENVTDVAAAVHGIESINSTIKMDSNSSEDTVTTTESFVVKANENSDKENGAEIITISNVSIADPQFNSSLNHDTNVTNPMSGSEVNLTITNGTITQEGNESPVAGDSASNMSTIYDKRKEPEYVNTIFQSSKSDEKINATIQKLSHTRNKGDKIYGQMKFTESQPPKYIVDNINTNKTNEFIGIENEKVTHVDIKQSEALLEEGNENTNDENSSSPAEVDMNKKNETVPIPKTTTTTESNAKPSSEYEERVVDITEEIRRVQLQEEDRSPGVLYSLFRRLSPWSSSEGRARPNDRRRTERKPEDDLNDALRKIFAHVTGDQEQQKSKQ